MMTTPEIAAIVLAAGRSTRWRDSGGTSTKLVAAWRGEPMVRRVAQAALASRARPVIVVTGAEADLVRAALSGLDVALVDNPRFGDGLSTSLAAGLAAVPATAAGALVLLGDMPEVTPALLEQLIAAFAEAPQAAAVVPTFAGERGNPVLLSRGLFAPARSLQGDQGARRLLAAAGADVRDVCVNEQAVRLDVDTVDIVQNVDQAGREAKR